MTTKISLPKNTECKFQMYVIDRPALDWWGGGNDSSNISVPYICTFRMVQSHLVAMTTIVIRLRVPCKLRAEAKKAVEHRVCNETLRSRMAALR